MLLVLLEHGPKVGVADGVTGGDENEITPEQTLGILKIKTSIVTLLVRDSVLKY